MPGCFVSLARVKDTFGGNMKKFLAICLLLSNSALAGGSSSSGPGHPALKVCHALQGHSNRYSTSFGEDFYCQFDRAIISSMTLWYSLTAKSEKAVTVFLRHPNVQIRFQGNPASQYCVAVGGRLEIAQVVGGNEIGMCVFEDKGHFSSIEEWTLYRGPADPGNIRLMNILTKVR